MQKFIGVIVGIIFLAAGIFLYYKNDYLVKNCTAKASATVVEMKEDFSDDSYIYYPIIEYKVNEDNIRVVMDKGSNPPAYSINEKISILYNPNKTNEFIVEGDSSSNIFSVIMMILGVAVTGYGIVMIFKKESN